MKAQRSLQPGDIFATKGTGIAGWAVRNLITPRTDRFHFGIIWNKWVGKDYLVLESLSKKGLSVGLLSWYKQEDLEFYRVGCPKELRVQAPGELINWGRSLYDYLLILKVALGFPVAVAKILIKERRLRKPKAEDFPYGVNSSLICTEAVDIAYDSVGVNLIPIGVLPFPNAFKQAEMDKKMEILTEKEVNNA